MQLADFIEREMPRIVAEWSAFAATRLPAARHMVPLELQDHVHQILEAIVADLRRAQTDEARDAKSKGLAPVLIDAPETAAEIHAALRAKSGFDITQLSSEYRALRASVLKLWMDSRPPEANPLRDVMRFNEAIDQALIESVARFHTQVEQARHLLLGTLTHDMRSPLQAIRMTAMYLAEINAGRDVSEAARRLIGSGGRLQALLDDMVDFNRANLGVGIGVQPSEIDLGALCAETVEEVGESHPGARLEYTVEGDCRGWWDGKRMQQLLSNLMTNALQYGDGDHPVRVSIRGVDSHVSIDVSNRGPPIDPDTLQHIFEPLKRGRARADRFNVGLGLFIVCEIARAHGGTVEVRSDVSETVFSARLPRRAGEGLPR